MGKNTPERQDFIIGNLRVDIDQLKPDEMDTLNVGAEIQEELVS